MKDGPDPAAPLWRAAQVFRLLSYLYAAWFEIASNGELARPALGWLLFGVLTAVTGACAVAYLQGFGRRPAWVVGEIVVVVLLMLSTTVVASDQWVADHQSWPTTLWATNATISAAILLGPTAGMLTGLVVMATGAVLKGHVNVDLGRNASIVVELAVGLAVGMAAQTARRAHAELTRLTRLSASLEERERLSRHVHDGVIQVLALVAKRGREIGGPTMELANLAAEQERALRLLVSTTDTGEDHRRSQVDMRGLLRRRESEQVSVSLPGTPVLLDSLVAAELEAAVGNALDNVASHAGSDAKAFVLLEDLGEAVTVSVRDDGVGIAAGRLEEAVGEGRAGISKSIVGRVRSLGGTAQLTSDRGAGTEWELTVPRRGARRG